MAVIVLLETAMFRNAVIKPPRHPFVYVYFSAVNTALLLMESQKLLILECFQGLGLLNERLRALFSLMEMCTCIQYRLKRLSMQNLLKRVAKKK